MTDREFWKYFTGMIAALAALAVVLFIVANAIGGKAKTDQAVAEAKSVAERIKPVGEVTVAAATTVANALVPVANAAGKGETVYNQICGTCHNAGVAGAPKLSDKAAWAPRVGKGVDELVKTVVKGKNAMPPKGGYAGPETDIKEAVTFMVSKVK
jgi:cytochrome c5